MLIYFSLLCVTVLLAYLARKTRSVLISRCFVGMIFLCLVLVQGLRDRTVGTDTGSYIGYFNTVRSIADVALFGREMWEHGFWLLNWLVNFISNDYMAFLIAISVLTTSFYLWVITRYSVRPELSIFVFIAVGYYTFSFNGARQGIACAIYALSITAMLEEDFKKYLFFVLLAFLFHKTAIVLIPLYFLFNRPITVRNVVLIAIIGFMVTFLIDKIVEIASSFEPRYSAYGAKGEGGGYFTVAFYVVNSIFFLLMRNSIRVHRDIYERLLNVLMFGVMIGVVSTVLGVNPSGLLRYVFYFTIAMLFLWPIVFENLPARWSKVVGYLFIMIYVTYFALSYPRFSNLVPYKFNSSISKTMIFR